jgi:hypothetical protein
VRHAELGGGGFIPADFDLHNRKFACVVLSELIEGRADDVAGAAILL